MMKKLIKSIGWGLLMASGFVVAQAYLTDDMMVEDYFLTDGSKELTGDITFDQLTGTPSITIEPTTTISGQPFSITGQDSDSSNGGPVNITSGGSDAATPLSAAGDVVIRTGTSPTGANGGDILLTPGATAGALSDAGDVLLDGGQHTGTGDGGNVEITGGASTSGTAGRVLIEGLTYPNADGTNGQTLTTNGAGVLSFTTPAAGSAIEVQDESVSLTTDVTKFDFQGAGVTVTEPVADEVVVTVTDNDTTDHTALSNIGTNTHAQIDTHIADGTVHFTQAAISITASQVSDFDTEVSNNVDVTANTAKVSADGSIGTHSDVNLTGLANNDVLVYNTATGDFEPEPQSGFTPTDIDTDYGNETVTSDWVMQGAGSTGAMGAYDLTIGDGAGHGGLRLGDAGLYNSSFTTGNLDLGQALVMRQEGNLDVTNDPGIEFALLESISNTVRLAVPESGAGNATAFIRSATFAGPYSSAIGNDIVTCDQWTTNDTNIDCDTSGTGADVFVQDDLEVGGQIFTDQISEEIAASGVTVDGVLIKDGEVDGKDVSTLISALSEDASPTLTAAMDANTNSITGITGIEVSSDIEMNEQADHSSTPTAGHGYLWTKNTTPSTLVFTDDTGTDTTLGSGGSASPLTTKGDLYGFDTADARIPVGTDGDFLVADSTDAQGVAWKDLTEVVDTTPSVGVRAYRSTNQSISATTITPVVFDTELYDYGSNYDTSTGTFTVPAGKAGRYLVTFSTQFLTVADQQQQNCYIEFASGDVSLHQQRSSGTSTQACHVIAVEEAAVGDTITADVYSGNADTLSGSSQQYTNFTVTYLDEPTIQVGGDIQAALSAASFRGGSTGTLTVSTSVIELTLGATVTNNDTANYSLAGNEVTITDAGTYLMCTNIMVDLATGTRDTMEAWVQVDDGGGYSSIPASYVGIYARITGEIQASGNCFTYIVEAGESYRLAGSCTAASACNYTLSGSTLSFVKLQAPQGPRGAPGPAGGKTVRLLPNSQFEIAQGGTSVVAIADNEYAVDTWRHDTSGASVYTVQRTSVTPTVAQAGRYIDKAIEWDVTTAETTVGATDLDVMSGFIEGHDYQHIAQQAFTVSFWHKHSQTGTYSVAFRNSGKDYYYIDTYVQDVADTWEFVELTIAAPPSAGTWDYDNDVGLQITWVWMCGSDYYGTEDAWTSGNELCVSGQANGADSTANYLRIADVHIESDSVTQGYANMQSALAHVQRYYVDAIQIGGGGYASAGAQTDRSVACTTYPTEMRVVPTRTYTNQSSTNTTGSLLTLGNDRTTGACFGFASSAAGSQYWRGYIELDARF